jgi:hypothetical protein
MKHEQEHEPLTPDEWIAVCICTAAWVLLLIYS